MTIHILQAVVLCVALIFSAIEVQNIAAIMGAKIGNKTPWFTDIVFGVSWATFFYLLTK